MFTITVSKISEVQKNFKPRIVKSKGNSIKTGMKKILTKNNEVVGHNES